MIETYPLGASVTIDGGKETGMIEEICLRGRAAEVYYLVEWHTGGDFIQRYVHESRVTSARQKQKIGFKA